MVRDERFRGNLGSSTSSSVRVDRTSQCKRDAELEVENEYEWVEGVYGWCVVIVFLVVVPKFIIIVFNTTAQY